jgi:hypothetical protein
MEILIIIAAIAATAFFLLRKRPAKYASDAQHASYPSPFDKLVNSYKHFQRSGGSSSTTDAIKESIIEIRNKYAKDTTKETLSDTIRIFSATALYDERNYRKNGVYAVDILSDLYLGPIREKAGPHSDDVKTLEDILVKIVGTSKSLYRTSHVLQGRLEGSDDDFLNQVEMLVIGADTMDAQPEA